MSYAKRVSNKYWQTGAWLTTRISMMTGASLLITIAGFTSIPYLTVAAPAFLLWKENEGHGDCPKWLLSVLGGILAPGRAVIAAADWARAQTMRSGWHETATVGSAMILGYTAVMVSIFLKFAPMGQPDLPEALAWFLFACGTATAPVNALFIMTLVPDPNGAEIARRSPGNPAKA